MALPQSGIITMGQVRTELKKTGSLNLGNIDVRKIAEKPSGTIKMSDLRGKSAEIVYTKLKEVSNAFVEHIQAFITIADVINPKLEDFDIVFEDNAVKGSVAFSKNKIYKAIITDATRSAVNSQFARFSVTADVYKGE